MTHATEPCRRPHTWREADLLSGAVKHWSDRIYYLYQPICLQLPFWDARIYCHWKRQKLPDPVL